MEFQITVGIGLASLFVAIVIPVIISYRERERKLVYWDVLSSESLSSFNISEKLEMKVMFDGKPLDDISTVELKVWNAGNKAILKSDYDKPIKFCTDPIRLDTKCVVVSVDRTEATVPASIGFQTQQE
jgi:hypothetical protein